MKTLISIIVPVYNIETYLPECLDSILNQNYKHIEVIAVNDGSTDSSAFILEQYAQKDNRIKVLHKSNGGLASARNFGLTYANGQYILFVDSDDLIAPQAIETLITVAEQQCADIISFGFKKFYKNTNISDVSNVETRRARTIDLQEMFRICFDENYKSEYSNGAYAWTRLFKRSILGDLKFDSTRKLYEDEDFTSKLLLSLNSSSNILFLDAPLYYYRQRKSSLVHSNRTKRLLALYSCRSAMLKRCETNSIEYDILSKARLTTLTKLMQASLAANYPGGFSLFKKIICSSKHLSLRNKIPYLLGVSVAKNYSVQRLEKAKRKNLKLQYWD